jgi:hypothetical protein
VKQPQASSPASEQLATVTCGAQLLGALLQPVLPPCQQRHFKTRAAEAARRGVGYARDAEARDARDAPLLPLQQLRR